MAVDSNAQNNPEASDGGKPDDKLNQQGDTLLDKESESAGAEGTQDQNKKDGGSSDKKDDGSSEDDGEGAEGKEGKEGEEDEGAPEEYADFTVPEGVELDSELLGEFKTLAKEQNLSQAKAQQQIDLANKAVQKAVNTAIEQQVEMFTKMRSDWVKNLKADKEFGGEKFNETVESAKRALKRFGSDALKAELKKGYGDNDELIKFMARVDQATKEDDLEDSDGQEESGEETAAQVLYGKKKK